MHLFPDSPSTVDFLFELNTKFSTIVTEKLEKRSQEAIQQQLDPDTMTDSEVQKIRKSIVKHVNGNTQFCACISLVNIQYL
jgi:hypothetical protein